MTDDRLLNGYSSDAVRLLEVLGIADKDITGVEFSLFAGKLAKVRITRYVGMNDVQPPLTQIVDNYVLVKREVWEQMCAERAKPA